MGYEYAVSACLCGKNVRYDGKSKVLSKWKELYDQGKVLLICPEVQGGLSIPREPSEMVGDKIMSRIGVDVTHNFTSGAQEALRMIQEHPSIHTIILKDNSPSCGLHYVYDGTFSGTKIEGMGVFARVAIEHGYKVYNEVEAEDIVIG